jgi:hypothetical protein
MKEETEGIYPVILSEDASFDKEGIAELARGIVDVIQALDFGREIKPDQAGVLRGVSPAPHLGYA